MSHGLHDDPDAAGVAAYLRGVHAEPSDDLTITASDDLGRPPTWPSEPPHEPPTPTAEDDAVLDAWAARLGATGVDPGAPPAAALDPDGTPPQAQDVLQRIADDRRLADPSGLGSGTQEPAFEPPQSEEKQVDAYLARYFPGATCR
jgi:hypothetical protein